MNENAIRSTIKSILHTKSTLSRDEANTLANKLASNMMTRYAEIAEHYNVWNQYNLAETYAADYIKRNS